MLIIGLDTTSQSGSVSLLRENHILGECLFNTGPRHSENVVSSLDWLINTIGVERSEIDAVAVSLGPGSFTSLRVGVTIAKSLAYSLKIQIAGVSSLEVLAMNVTNTPLDICVLLDAKRDELYSAVFRYNNSVLDLVSPEKLQHIEDLTQEITSPTLFIGEGALIHREKLAGLAGSEFADEKFNIPHSYNTALLGMKKLLNGESDDVIALVPNYVKKTDVELSIKT